MSPVRPSDWLWKEGAGYYIETADRLEEEPMLPDPGRLRDRRLLDLFERHADLRAGEEVLEVGCGRSRWLPFLALRKAVHVAGLDIEPYALELARANLAGAGAVGRLLCRDAFDPEQNADLRGCFDLIYSMGVMEHFDDVVTRLAILALYLRPGGRILTLVPNLQGVNWLLQRLADRGTLEMHVIYDDDRLRRVHEAAGFETIEAGYAGFYDGFLSCSAAATGRIRRWVHGRLCRATNLACEAWTRLMGGSASPECTFTSPHVFYVGRRPVGREATS